MRERLVNRTLLGIIALAMALQLPAASVARAEMNMEDSIKSAKTAADHEAIAAEYDKMAAEAKAKATDHRGMGDGYGTVMRSPGPRGQATTYGALMSHCRTLSKDALAEAKEYEQMAAEHRALAKKVK